MEFESEIIIDKTKEEVKNIIDRRIAMGWQIHSISEISKKLTYSAKGHFNKTFGDSSESGSIWGATSLAITYMKLSEEDKNIRANIQAIADRLSKN